ncbi:hypothetical protein [Mobilicoccus caccae]|uniref:Major facilitator superfamily (MFS) profile domain-containing protein n=1 Tax=Mobilicoccus caccae TaxID=1859295 RepID=A0ABQ6IPS7_9MICO|nr:hypothetical protein [Mobilicoccus caccae]GMA39212.1 hypothetical protein GCM10025883_12570 [Mobilicoccus caccae]
MEAQGFTDAVTSLVGALGAAAAGLVMGVLHFPGVGAVYGLLAAAALVSMWLLAGARQGESVTA